MIVFVVLSFHFIAFQAIYSFLHAYYSGISSLVAYCIYLLACRCD